jgi:hypothetical protein
VVLHRHLLEEEISLRIDEGGEGTPPTKMHPDGLEALVQTADDVEDEGAVGDGLAQVLKHVRHALHLLAVRSDRQIALDEVAELRLEE